MEYVIRKGTDSDLVQVMQLVKDLAEFEKAPEAVTNTVERMRQERQHFDFFVATDGDEIVGMALYFFAYYTWVGKSLYLDDLFVKPEHRGNKIASKLLKEVFKVAQDQNCQRVRWQVLDWNQGAIDVYKKLGADLDAEWINCNFLPEQFADLAN